MSDAEAKTVTKDQTPAGNKSQKSHKSHKSGKSGKSAKSAA